MKIGDRIPYGEITIQEAQNHNFAAGRTFEADGDDKTVVVRQEESPKEA